jgi:hypothetical protein
MTGSPGSSPSTASLIDKRAQWIGSALPLCQRANQHDNERLNKR